MTPSRSSVERAARYIDLKDAPIVAAAIRARADYLATYDRKDLISQRSVIERQAGLIAALPDEILSIVRSAPPKV